MYLLLLGFGTLLALAGVVLSAAGISIHERALDTTIVTPGIVAVIGGLVVIGLGLALRVLQRIEKVLVMQPMPRPARSAEPAEAAASAFPIEPPRNLLPPRTRAPLNARRAAAGAPPIVAEPAPEDLADRRADVLLPYEAPAAPWPLEGSLSAAAEGSQDHAESGLGLDLGAELTAGLAAALAQHSGSSSEPPHSTETSPPASEPLSSPAPVPDHTDDVGLLNTARATRRLNGTAPVRTMPRLDLSARFPLASERPKGPSLDAMWPKAPRPLRPAPAGSARSATEPPAAPPPAAEANKDTAVAAAPAAVPLETSHPVSILKSGVVDGMAYTLFTDGSIEAALPQGRLRFGSISELRQHIEQSA